MTNKIVTELDILSEKYKLKDKDALRKDDDTKKYIGGIFAHSHIRDGIQRFTHADLSSDNAGLEKFHGVPQMTLSLVKNLEKQDSTNIQTMTYTDILYDNQYKSTLTYGILIPKTRWAIAKNSDGTVKDFKGTAIDGKDYNGFQIDSGDGGTGKFWYYRMFMDSYGVINSVQLKEVSLDREYHIDNETYSKMVFINIKMTQTTGQQAPAVNRSHPVLSIYNPYGSFKDSLPFFVYNQVGHLDIDSIYKEYIQPYKAVVNLGDLGNVNTAGGSTGQVLAQQADGSFALDSPTTIPPQLKSRTNHIPYKIATIDNINTSISTAQTTYGNRMQNDSNMAVAMDKTTPKAIYEIIKDSSGTVTSQKMADYHTGLTIFDNNDSQKQKYWDGSKWVTVTISSGGGSSSSQPFEEKTLYDGTTGSAGIKSTLNSLKLSDFDDLLFQIGDGNNQFNDEERVDINYFKTLNGTSTSFGNKWLWLQIIDTNSAKAKIAISYSNNTSFNILYVSNSSTKFKVVGRKYLAGSDSGFTYEIIADTKPDPASSDQGKLPNGNYPLLPGKKFSDYKAIVVTFYSKMNNQYVQERNSGITDVSLFSTQVNSGILILRQQTGGNNNHINYVDDTNYNLSWDINCNMSGSSCTANLIIHGIK